ncbi:hypothetical protein JCM11251_002195 [Rhodosporidiobolus azoricus]
MHNLATYVPLPQYPPPSRATRTTVDPSLSEPDPLFTNCCRLLTRPKSLVAFLTGCFFVFLIVCGPSYAKTPRERSLLALGEDPAASWADLFSLSQAGWEEYEPPMKPEAERQFTDGQLATWSDGLSSPCADTLVVDGRLCDEAGGTFAGQDAVDLLWTWTNGSDPLLRRWRAEATTTLPGKVRPGGAKVREKLTARHFRDHDELRYSLRSALSAFVPSALRKIHLVTTDLPSNALLSDLIDGNNLTQTVQSSRVGQVPVWLNRSPASANPALEVLHHTAIFEDSSSLPTFNSLSIESQFPHLDATGEFALYLNDDTFLLDTHRMTAADVGAPLLGPVFRIQTDLAADGRSPSSSAGPPDGEWASLHRADYLLDQRFGRRSRGYLAHIPKTLSMRLLREMSMIWHDELLEVSASRFRGQRTEYQLAFLATHFVIEAHREALLHAFFLARSDRDLDGFLSPAERRTLLTELGFSSDAFSTTQQKKNLDPVPVPFPRRSTRQRMPHLLRLAGLSPPGETDIAFSSFDGFGMGTVVLDGDKPYPGPKEKGTKLAKTKDKEKERRQLRSTKPRPKHYLRPVLHVNEADEPLDALEAEKDGKVACTLEMERCFGADFLDPLTSVSAMDVFRRMAYDRPQCGDCAVVALVGKSGRSGLSAFLPECDASSALASPTFPPSSLVSTAKTFADVVLPHSVPSASFSAYSSVTCSSARALSIRRILRYSYTLGDSESRFIPMQAASVTNKALDEMVEKQERGEKLPTFLTLNDDFKTDAGAHLADEGLRKFFEQQWPNPSPYEKQSSEGIAL